MRGISKKNENVRFRDSGKFLLIWAYFIQFSAKNLLIQGKFTQIGRFSLKNFLDDIFEAKFNFNGHCGGEFFPIWVNFIQFFCQKFAGSGEIQPN
jgi:hypothetical protein